MVSLRRLRERKDIANIQVGQKIETLWGHLSTRLTCELVFLITSQQFHPKILTDSLCPQRASQSYIFSVLSILYLSMVAGKVGGCVLVKLLQTQETKTQCRLGRCSAPLTLG